MAKDIKCAHCNSRRLVATHQKGILQCRDCEGATDLNGNRIVVKIIGTAVGVFLTTLTFGFLPDDIQDQIADAAGDFVGDLLA